MMNDIFHLSRFISAHQSYYDIALREIRRGRKESHWMWYIFPQLEGLGKSSTSQYYAIHGAEEAKAFLEDPYLGGNLLEISQALLHLDKNNIRDIFDPPDDMKLKSSMTLFSFVDDSSAVFDTVLDKYFDGRRCRKTQKYFRDRISF